mgnify:CR=1 FL=1
MKGITIFSNSKNLTPLARDLKSLGYKVILYTPYRMVVHDEKLEQVVGLVQLLTGAQITVTNN